MNSNLPASRGGGGGGGLSRYTERAVNRELDRYEVRAHVAKHHEVVDQLVLSDCVMEAMFRTGQIVDVGRAIAQDDPAKGALCGQLAQAFVDISVGRMAIRFGGA